MTLQNHYMETPEHKWSVGELVSLTWNERQLKKNGSTSYAELVSSRYICVREATDEQPSSTFWVRGIAGRMLGLKKLQFFDASTGQLSKALDDTPHYRLTIAFFNKEELSW